MITHYFRTVKDTALKTFDEPRAGVWTHVVKPGEEELKKVIEAYALDATIVNDINDFFEVPRFEKGTHAAYFFARYPYDEKDEDTDTAPILMILGESFVVTIVQREVPFLNSLIQGETQAYTTQKTKLFLNILTALTRAYEHELVRMRKGVYRDRTRVRAITGKDIQRLVSFEHKLNDIVSALIPTNVWLQQLAKGNYIQLFTDDVALMEDLTIANNQLVESAKSILKTIQNVRGAAESILTLKLNNTIQLLTALTIILTIPTLISSLFGMNVALPLDDHPHAFWLIVTLIVTVVSLMLYFFNRQRWF